MRGFLDCEWAVFVSACQRLVGSTILPSIFPAKKSVLAASEARHRKRRIAPKSEVRVTDHADLYCNEFSIVVLDVDRGAPKRVEELRVQRFRFHKKSRASATDETIDDAVGPLSTKDLCIKTNGCKNKEE